MGLITGWQPHGRQDPINLANDVGEQNELPRAGGISTLTAGTVPNDRVGGDHGEAGPGLSTTGITTPFKQERMCRPSEERWTSSKRRKMDKFKEKGFGQVHREERRWTISKRRKVDKFRKKKGGQVQREEGWTSLKR